MATDPIEERRSLPAQPNGGSRPVPDPTVLTDQAIAKAINAVRDWVESQFQVRDERLAGIDEATKLRLQGVTDIPKQIDTAVDHLKELHAEKFGSVAQQFVERDTRSERESRDNKVAVDAAFAAQKEAAAKQDEANAKAIDKSEKATAETIKTNQELNQAKTEGLTKTLDDLKDRVGRIESVKVGATENRTGLYATIGIVSTVFFLVVGILGFLATQGRVP